MKAPDPNLKPVKYLIARKKGMNKSKAALAAGYSSPTQSAVIERGKTYLQAEKYYRDVLLNEISLEQLAQEHLKNIVQDEDKGAKNKAIEMALSRIEPDASPEKDDEQMIVVMRG